jgi:hypothetical protein
LLSPKQRLFDSVDFPVVGCFEGGGVCGVYVLARKILVVLEKIVFLFLSSKGL